jgi:succinate dehydrogenase / fumarate reductase cytochrome b subunit
MTDATKGPRARPLSPFTSIWRWHVTMVTSILHRVTGVALYGAALVLTAWAICLASGPDAYAGFLAVARSIIGQLALLAITLSAFYHLAKGLQHLVWDSGRALDVKTASLSSWVVIAFTILATVAVWFVACTGGLA